MKVFFVNPLAGTGRGHAHFLRDWCGGESPTSVIYPPLEIASTAALLRQNGIQVSLLDANALHLDNSVVLRLIQAEQPDFLGFPSAWGSIKYDLDLARMVKNALPQVRIVIWGPNVSVMPDIALDPGNVDYVILGEPEFTFLNLLKGDLSENLAYSKDGKLALCKRSLRMDLDALPFAARELLPNARYRSVLVKNNPFTLMMTSRGCPYHCEFCQAQIWFQDKLRFRSTSNIIEEIRRIVEIHHIPQIIFRDLTLTVNRKHIMSICGQIIKHNLRFSWRCFSCVDTVDKELLDMMHKAGCNQISYGIESGSQAVLDQSGKGITLEQSREAVRLTKNAGIEACCNFMLGMRGDTKQTIQQTIDFALELDPDLAQFQVAVPVYATEFYDACFGAKRLLSAQALRWYNTELVNPGFTCGFLNGRLRAAYTRFYFRLPVIARHVRRSVCNGNAREAFSTLVGLLKGLLTPHKR
ncbi:MAG: radical SAM protein [Candidatus Omnitrophica bacterium]|jgi:radical SAM superfamily enzyme YgiQ (UPF0313 family)|nr:B12-binding domain-containing radical SAM protein [Candidatus Omnitrophota bacterium]MDD5080200.1 radical SAM protein [Candidatus Omnitrophota bacterium]